MTEIKNRIDFLQTFHPDKMPVQIIAELYALQLRKIVEGIVFSSLTADREKYAELHRDFEKDWKIKRIMERIKGFNKDYLPIPVKDVERNGQKV